MWTQAEVEKQLGPQSAPAFVYHYGLQKGGNVPAGSDPGGELQGKNILTQRHSTAESQVESSLAESRRLLFERREKRPRPPRDDKIITA